MVKKVFIDPGHGGIDSGAVGVDNLLEKDINLSVAKKVESLLKTQNLEIKLSRTSDTEVSLDERTKAANSWNADCYVSIHCNAYNGSTKGVETFSYSTATNDLAKYVHDEIIISGAYTVNRGLKTASFYVLKYTTMRACLIEMAFIDNVDDSKILVQRQDDLALAITKGICKYLGFEYTPVTTDPNTFYRVICGSFNNKSYAEERMAELKALGYNDVFIDVYTKE